jgi:glycosyltransferase involved in cell wall biosynthesis
LQEARKGFSELLASSPDTESLGPNICDIKDRFYERLDLFLFPTRYANEAEPFVTLDALRSGVPVIACDRGAIAELLGNGAGVVFRIDFVDGAVMHIERLSHNRGLLKMDQRLAQEQFQRIRGVAYAAIASLLSEIWNY